MKPMKPLFLLVLLISAAVSVNAQDKYSKVKIYTDPQNIQKQRDFIYGDLQVDHCHFEGDDYVIEISADELALLKASSFRYDILVDDVAEHFRLTSDVSRFYESDQRSAQNRSAFITSCETIESMMPTPSQFTPGAMGGYYTYAEMVTKIGWLVDNFPSIVDTFSIGRSFENRDIWCVKISDNVLTDEAEGEVLLNGLQHAREAIAGTSLIFYAQYLVQNYGSNTRVQQLVNSREIFIIPCTNPDGYVRNQTTNPGGGGNWRKNRRTLAGGNFGVDLNRNYNADWANCSTPTPMGTISSCGNGSALTSNDTYWGTAPFSEPETQAIRTFTAQRNFLVSIDQHSEGEYNTTPHGRMGVHPTHNLVDSQYLYGFSSSVMATYNCHRIGNNYQTLNYEVAGGNKDWMFQGDTSMTTNPRKVYSFTSEAGGGSFWPAAVNIIPLSKGLTFQFIQASLTAGGYADIQDVNDVALTLPSGNMAYEIRRVGVVDRPVTVQMIPVQNIIPVGSPDVIGAIGGYNATVTGDIPYNLPGSITAGQRIRFVWRVTCDGITVDDTVTKFYNPITIVYDDMETGAVTDRWTVAGGFGYSSAQAFGGTRSLSESPSGNYGASSTRTATFNTDFDLSTATAAWLSFWVKYRAENCMDILRVRVSTNNGTSWTNLCGKYTIAENKGNLGGTPGLTGIRETWTRELFDLSQFLGQPDVRFQFQFTSNADVAGDPFYREQDDGFSIDNFRLMTSNTTLMTLPVNFLSFSGKLLPNETVQLDWEATVDAQHDYFDIEKSYDKNNFVTLGRVATAPPYRFFDPSVKQGNNYYRVKQVDKDGTISYSKIINIIYNKGKIDFILYPNPVTEVLNLQVDSDKPANYMVAITDLMGKKVYEQKITPDMAGRTLQISLKDKATGLYVLTIRNEENEVLATEKIIKQ
jgi:carboxypeptidase T